MMPSTTKSNRPCKPSESESDLKASTVDIRADLPAPPGIARDGHRFLMTPTGRFVWATEAVNEALPVGVGVPVHRGNDARWKEIAVPFMSGAWYADPYAAGAHRWYDETRGWTDRVEGEGLEPDKTGVARTDDAAASTADSIEDVTPTARPGRLGPVNLNTRYTPPRSTHLAP